MSMAANIATDRLADAIEALGLTGLNVHAECDRVGFDPIDPATAEWLAEALYALSEKSLDST